MRKKNFTRLTWAALLLFSLFPSLWAQELPTAKVEDDSALRRSLLTSWLKESPGKVLAARSFMQTLPGGSRIQVRAEERNQEFTILLAREQNLAGGSRTYPGWVQGSWVLARRKDDGSNIHIRFFPRSDPYMYVQFRPMEGGKSDKSLMDVVIYDAYMVHSLAIPFSFDRLLEIPVEEALRSAGSIFPRRYFEPQVDQYRDIRSVIVRIRDKLPALTFRDDGAIDNQGRYVFINTLAPQEGPGGLNCSGFAKWVIDGLLKPMTGERLPIEPLKEAFGTRGSSFTEPWEQLRDPFFGLDWTRNLASRANKTLFNDESGTNMALLSPVTGALEEIEVRSAPFGSVIVRDRGNAPSGIRPYPGFLFNAGFGVEGLQALLYTLAIDEPGRIYLVSVNNEIGAPTTAKNPRGLPRMRQHFHVAVLVPYFNEYGVFQIAVFESAAETSFTAFKNRYPGHYVNLVRVPVEGVFDPD
ncbi:hypothetical protein AGMMS49991_07360 [Spirochaetia bacterium]|nr:hypothetical protein AGMMS49991_07360 [Spirochaetia bacterium]